MHVTAAPFKLNTSQRVSNIRVYLMWFWWISFVITSASSLYSHVRFCENIRNIEISLTTYILSDYEDKFSGTSYYANCQWFLVLIFGGFFICTIVRCKRKGIKLYHKKIILLSIQMSRFIREQNKSLLLHIIYKERTYGFNPHINKT